MTNFYLKKYILSICLNNIELLITQMQLMQISQSKSSNFMTVTHIINKENNFQENESDHKIVSEIFTTFNFKNYVLSSFPCFKKKIEILKFKLIEKNVEQYLSIKNIINSNYPSLNNLIIAEENKDNEGILKSFDILSSQKYFYKNGKKEFTTLSGKILTMMFVIICAPIIYFFGKDCILKQNPTAYIYDIGLKGINSSFYVRM